MCSGVGYGEGSLKVFRGGIVSGGITGGGSFPGSLKRIGKTRLF